MDSVFPTTDERDWWARGADHQSALYEEGAVFESLASTFSQIPHPTLLMRGYYDAVFGPDQMNQYLLAKPDTQLVVADKSSHFVHVEQPDRFATVVVNWLGSKA